MKLNRRLLKIKSKFYYYSVVFLGAISVFFFTRCDSPKAENNNQQINDSIAKAKAKQDSIAKADSIAKVEKELATLDSIARADSIAKAKKKPNPYKPDGPVCKYGVYYNKNKD